MFASMLASRRPSLDHDEGGEPPGKERGEWKPHPRDGQQAGERRPLDEAGAPHVLAQLGHLHAPAVEADVDVPVDVDVDAEDRAGREADLIEGEQWDVAEPALLVCRQRQEARKDRECHDRSLAPASGEEIGEDDSGHDEVVRGLHQTSEPECASGEGRVAPGPRLERAGDERRDAEQRDHGREVGHPGEPDGLGEELIDPTLVVALDEERDCDERRRDPQHGRPESKRAPADPAGDRPDAHKRERREHEDVECCHERHGLDEGRSEQQRDRREDRATSPGSHPRAAARDGRTPSRCS